MPLHRSQDELRAQNWRPDELPGIPDAAASVPDRDPSTGRFTLRIPFNLSARSGGT
jgi:hypothetical protein